MAEKIKWTEEEKYDIKKLYLDGQSQTDIGKKYKVDSTIIRKILVEANIPIRNSKEQKNLSKNRNKKLEINPEIEQLIINEYVLNKKSIYYIEKNTGVSQFIIERILKNNGVKKRTYTEAKQISRKYTINDDFFKEQSHDMAYILGLIASDGNISKKENSISIELEKTDAYLLDRINQITNNNRPLKYYSHKHKDGISTTEVAKFQTWSAEWKKDLKIYNLIPNKTFLLQPPEFLKDEYYISYIKGYFDGDGSIYVSPNMNRCSIIFVGASKPLLDWIKSIFVNKYGIISSIVGLRIFLLFL